ncbi:hypothetical protein Patl1_17667 [Pistacia atlantica]|uniref:Uncharacterized protein n=1 Tax=Pistacia atlantica TaxID=434234 RepID=A0ACC1C2T5_9ROSI|nr:hypothetical protein Patl1_17667 [Pistacia atlantica]
MEELWTSLRRTQVLNIIGLLVVLVLLNTNGVESRKKAHDLVSFQYPAINCRAHSASLEDFGGVGDGTTSNTKAFKAAIDHLSQFATVGGSQLYIPPGKWLTGSFNLTSHFTLYLHRDAVLLASQVGKQHFKVSAHKKIDEREWPIIKPLPSYGRGRDNAVGGRYISLIFGTNLTDVVITGDNGTINGQGEPWWKKFLAKKLKYTRPYLIEILYSENVQISSLTFINAPYWNIHPTYCSNVIIQGLTILAPVTIKNTDGIDPDSCTNTRIEDCYIVSGDDCIAVKSGWDEYGVSFGMPTKQLAIRRLTCISPFSAVIALGSEMSGGIEDVRAEDITAIHSESGVRIKTSVGRGGFVKDIYVRRDDSENHEMALPVIQNINYRDIVAENVTMAAKLEGIPGDTFSEICISNATIGLTAKPKELQWNCTDVKGISSGVTPKPCEVLPDQGPAKIKQCKFPVDSLPIDNVKLRTCYYKK